MKNHQIIGLLIFLSSVLLPSHGAALSVPHGVHVSFDTLSGQQLLDIKNSETIAVLGRSVRPEASDPSWHAAGKFGGAVIFDGVDDVITISSTTLPFVGMYYSFTIEMWIKALSIDQYQKQTIMMLGDWETGNIRLQVDTEGRIVLIIWYSGGGDKNLYLTSRKSVNGRWNHIALVKDYETGMIRFYMNGMLAREVEVSESILKALHGATLMLGGGDRAHGFKGLIDEFAVTPDVKRFFDLNVSYSDPKIGRTILPGYSPFAEATEAPDEGLLHSWEVLRKNELVIVPAPKEITIQGDAMRLDSSWVIDVRTSGLNSAIELINEKLIAYGGRALPHFKAGDNNAIIVGVLDDLADYMKMINSPLRSLPRQGYIIDVLNENGRKRIIIAGADVRGAMYGCITFSMLIKKGAKVIPAQIRDWPDFRYRAGFNIIDENFENARRVIDQAFKAKLNIVTCLRFYWGFFDDMLKKADPWTKINMYAKKRGIKIMYHSWLDVGRAAYTDKFSTYNKYFYPYNHEEGLIGHRGRAFTWSRDDLIQEKGKLLAQLIRRTGASAFYLESMDIGGIGNPENWRYRTPLDIQRYGSDRSMADANLVSLIFRELAPNDSNILFVAVLYPYAGKFLNNKAVSSWLKKTAELIPQDIFFCVREGTRLEIKKWKKTILNHGMFVYYSPYPWQYRFFFSSNGRYARTFFFDDNDIYWFSPHIANWPEIWVAAEYAWNTKAPGWGWLPEDYKSVERAEASPSIITNELLPRVCKLIYGDRIYSVISEVLSYQLSSNIAVDTNYLDVRDPEGYFFQKYQKALKAQGMLKDIKKDVELRNSYQFSVLEKSVANARYLLEARYRYYLSRRMIALGRYSEADAALGAAETIVQKLVNKRWKDVLMDDINRTRGMKRRKQDRSKAIQIRLKSSH